jgi:hypothetical protein
MKKIILLACILFLSKAIAQPVILNSAHFFTAGYTSPIYTATYNISAGSAGAAQTWNFSTVPFTLLGAVNAADVSTSTYRASYPTANVLYTATTGTNTLYYYFDTTTSGLYEITDAITSPGIGNDFSPKPMQLLQFPFHYQDSVSSTFQKVGGNLNTEWVVYDGYGTLILPYNTFSNVVRVKIVHPTATIYYWYTLNPLTIVLSHNTATNAFSATNPTLTGVEKFDSQNSTLHIYPNPAQNNFTIEVSTNEKQTLQLFDINGKLILQQSIQSNTVIDARGLSNGIYYACIINNNSVATKKLVIVK